MLKPIVPVKEFEKFGFKKCRSVPSDNNCYYLCVARGSKMLFVSPVCFEMLDWADDDPRIHKRANCRYSDPREALDIVYELIQSNMIDSDFSPKA
mgnify:CR=1 FL=1